MEKTRKTKKHFAHTNKLKTLYLCILLINIKLHQFLHALFQMAKVVGDTKHDN